jgi:L-gulono-1,4-lactone dehydrogenase
VSAPLVDRRGRWSNWGHSASSTPAAVAVPASEDELCSLLAAAHREGRRVKVVGGSHSFTDIAATNGTLVSLDKLQGLTSVDPVSGLVSMLGGTRVWTISDALEPYGLALPNMGDIDRQSIAGALSTGTHGTGLAYTGYSGIARGFRLALADGSVVTATAQENPELFQAARVGLGALGVILEVTLACVPSFMVRADEHPLPLRDMLGSFVELCRSEDHVEFYWFQHTQQVAAKVNTRLPADAERAPLSRRQILFDDELLSNGGHRALCELGRVAPGSVPALNRFATKALASRVYTDRSDKIFVSPRRTRFREMEYAVPLQDFEAVFAEVMAAVNGFGAGITFPLEVRAAAADDTWIGTASGRESAYIALHRFVKEDHVPYFAAVEPILKAAAGRPHWGKLHTHTAEELRSVYPRFDDFLAVRDRVDPTGVFANAYLDRVLGEAPGRA